ncbi:MAG: YqeG family HAD IIIA-type phosphatase [Candidatus Margulisiibacteriota bacterium]
MFNFLQPKQVVKNIYEIDFATIKAKGINSLILDIDDTLIPRRSVDVPLRVFEWIAKRKEEGFKLCLTSNSRHPLRVKFIGEALDLPYLYMSFKPLPFAFWKSMKLLHTNPKQTAMIGDQLFMDTLGANLLGIHSIYVTPMTAETFYPRIVMRQIEKKIIN